jgi:hypothetical protein
MMMTIVFITMSNSVPLLEFLCTSTSISIRVLGFTFTSFALLFRKKKCVKEKKQSVNREMEDESGYI